MNADVQRESKREYEFFAFISYKRGEEDERWARLLQRELEHYRIPVKDFPGGGIFSRHLRVFRDKSDLGSHSALQQGLSENLNASRYLIVICSKRSAASPYVDAEVRHFVETDRADNIIPFFIEPPADKFFYASAYEKPPSLPGIEGVSAAEGREESFIRLLARLLQVDYDNLWQAHLRAARRRAVFRLCAVAAVAVLTAFLGIWAVSAERRATALRQESEELVDFLTFDLIRETTRWLPSDKLASISERVSEYYERWEAREPKALFAKAVNLAQRAGVETRNFNPEDAKASLRQSLDILESLRRREPENEAFLLEYSQTLLSMGELCEQKEEMSDAEGYYRKSLDAVSAFSDAASQSLKAAAQRADSLEHLAKLAAAMKNFESAENFARQGGELWDDMLRRWPEETQTWLWQMRYGSFMSALGHIAFLRNDFAYAYLSVSPSALEHVEKALSVFAKLYDEDPQNFVTRLFYADELSTAAFMAAKLKERDTAEFYYSAGEELWRGLVAEDPQPGYLFGWARVLTTGGMLRTQQGRFTEAGTLLDDAEEIIGGLLRYAQQNSAYEAQKGLIAEYRELLKQSRRAAPEPQE